MAQLSSLPILVTGFNRPALLHDTLSRLRDFGQKNVWISIDGPRLIDVRQDQFTYQCREVAKQFRDISNGRVLIRENNLGCKYGMSDAISWFFANNSMGLVIEDDIVFQSDFLRFSHDSLTFFEDDMAIGSITGFMPIEIQLNPKYMHSKYVTHPFFSAWGWGSWSNRWAKYDLEMQSWRRELSFSKLVTKVKWKFPRYWSRRFDEISSGQIDTWDFQFLFAHLKYDWHVIAPSRNLIQNVGFGQSATHTKKFREIPDLCSFEDGVCENSNPVELSKIDLTRYLRKQFGLSRWYSPV